MINTLAQKIHQGNKDRGFYEGPKNIGEMLCLIHSEVSEALECDRNDKYSKAKRFNIRAFQFLNDEDFKVYFESVVKDTFEDELADVMIRVMDLAAFLDVDLETHIEAKHRYNQLRPYKHGKKY